MVFHFYRGNDCLKFDLPGVREVSAFQNTLICAGSAEGASIGVRVDYSVPPKKISPDFKPCRRMGLSGFYEIIETKKVSYYTEYIPIGEGKRKIQFQFFLFENSLPNSPARPIKELFEIPDVIAFLLSIKSDN